jgi:hypothetical protein
VETLYHQGFETRVSYGGDHHPLSFPHWDPWSPRKIARAFCLRGSEAVVRDAAPHMIAVAMTVLSAPARTLAGVLRQPDNVLLVPEPIGRFHRGLTPPAGNAAMLFAGNFYGRRAQPGQPGPASSTVWAAAPGTGLRLWVLGPGNTAGLDKQDELLGLVPTAVRDTSIMPTSASCCRQALLHNNESTIYHYLRVGLP